MAFFCKARPGNSRPGFPLLERMCVMGEVTFLMFNSETGQPQGTVSGSPADVADFLSIWVKNTNDGLDLARCLGVDPGLPDEQR